MADLKAPLKKEQDGRKDVSKAAVVKFQQSNYYDTEVKNRYIGGWNAAHRCVMHELKVTKEQWAKVEDANEDKELHLNPTG